MSLIKWTLAMAGTALGLRYMSDRHRKRSAGNMPEQRAAQTDRDSDPAWSTAPGGVGSSISSTPGTPADNSELQPPDSTVAPGGSGSSAGRF